VPERAEQALSAQDLPDPNEKISGSDATACESDADATKTPYRCGPPAVPLQILFMRIVQSGMCVIGV
jgi:hypothetical protein